MAKCNHLTYLPFKGLIVIALDGCFSADDSTCVDDSTYYYCQQYHQPRHVLTSLSASHVIDDVALEAPRHVYVYGAGVERAPVGIYSASGAEPDDYPLSRHCAIARGSGSTQSGGTSA